MNILDSIMAERRADADASRKLVPLEQLEELAADREHHSLVEALTRAEGTKIVAEVKKASPSAGLLRADYDPAGAAGIYAVHGAAGISVLTEPRHFLGSEEHLREVRRCVGLPILRKDFICDSYQVAEAAAWGADAVLLILAALSQKEADKLYAAALRHRLDVLAEAHTAGEIERAALFEKAVIGINNRDLKTLGTDLAVARDLAERVPSGRICIAESGIRSRSDIERLEAAGYRGFLVGEVLMSAPDPGAKLEELRGAAD